MTPLRPLFALGASLALSACLSFGSKPPPTLMTLTAASPLPAQTNRTGTAARAITVLPPTATQEIATLRVPVRSGNTAVAYLKDAQWVEAPAVLFGRLLSETIASTTGRVVLDPRQFSFDPGTRLTGQLHTFGLDGARLEAVVVYDAALSRGADGIETHRFEARVPVGAATAAAVAPALNQAANQVAAEVARWVGS